MMRIFTALVLIGMTIGIAQAENFFPNNNPFATETNTPNLNNIYETTPQAMEQEKQTVKKVKKSRWWAIKEDTNDVIQAPEHQRAEDSGFVIFK